MSTDEWTAHLESLLETEVDIDDPEAVHQHVCDVMDAGYEIYKAFLEAKYPSVIVFKWGEEPALKESDLQRLKRRPGRPRVYHEPTLSDGSRMFDAVKREIALFTE